MKIGLLTAIWGRPRLTELVLRYYAEYFWHIYVVASPDDNNPVKWLDIPFDVKPQVIMHPNQPLSDKWQAGISAIEDDDIDIDAVMIVGSDDLVTPKYLEACMYLMQNGADYIYLPGCYFYDAPTKRMIWGQAERLGLGRCISRRLLDRLDWQPWPEGLTHGLDGAMWERVQSLGDVRHVCLKDAHKNGYIGMDIKTGENIWGFDHIRENVICYDVEAEPVLRKHFPSVADELLNW